MFGVPYKRGAKVQDPFDNGAERVFVIRYNEKVENIELELQSSGSDSLTGRGRPAGIRLAPMTAQE